MWEDLKVYKQLDKKDINPTFKKMGSEILSHLTGYSVDQTNAVIKVFRISNQLEQAIFIEKSTNSYDISVKVCIKPSNFYRRHRFTMINIVELGKIMSNHRKTSYPLTQEWQELAAYLGARIGNEIQAYFEQWDSYDKILQQREEIEPKNGAMENRYELLIYAAAKMKDKNLLINYLDKKLSRPAMQITKSEYLKLEENEINEITFLQELKELAEVGDFHGIERCMSEAANMQR